MSFLAPSGAQNAQQAPPGTIATGLIPSSQDLAGKHNLGVTQQRSRRRSTIGNVLQTAESIKERQVFRGIKFDLPGSICE